jgi:sortase A
MKKILFLFAILMIVAGAVWVMAGVKSATKAQPAQVLQSVSENILPTKTALSTPKRLIIQKIDVDAAIESVGQDEKGNMDVPKKDENVGWYELGYKPGDEGSAVMAGHFDTRTGAPAVFYNISKLQPGDTIEVVDENDNSLTYSVTDTATYDFDKVPLQKIFATKGKKALNLITCEGVFDRESKNYSKRLVVYAEIND